MQLLMEAIIFEEIRTKAINEQEFLILIDQGIDAFQDNKNMTDQETFGAIGAMKSVLDMIKRAKDAKILP